MYSCEWMFPISPIAASRPRVSKYGAYYAGPYKRFRSECAECVYDIIGSDFNLLEGTLHVDLELYVKRPKRTILSQPKADIDNYIKSILDVMNGKLWLDDTQIKTIYASKEWAAPQHDGYFNLGVQQM